MDKRLSKPAGPKFLALLPKTVRIATFLALGLLLLNPVFSGAASLVDGVPLPDNIKVEKPPENLPAEVKKLSGIWEGEWRSVSVRPGRLKAILVVERLSDRGARVLYAWGECPDWLVLKGWGRYEANISQDAGGVGLSFTTSEGIKKLFNQ